MEQVCGLLTSLRIVEDPRMIEQACVRRLKAREAAAWDELVDQYHDALARFACHALGGWSEDVPDLIQEVFLKAYHAIPEFRGDSSIHTWLFRIAMNTCRDHCKSGWKQRAVLRCDLPPEPEGGDDTGGSSLPEWPEIRHALAVLPEEERVCVELRFFHELSGREIAQVVGRNESTVWSRIYAGLRHLRASLEERG